MIRICPTPGFYTGRRKVPFITRGKTPAPSQRPAWILACPAWALGGTSKGGHGQEAPTPCKGSCTPCTLQRGSPCTATSPVRGNPAPHAPNTPCKGDPRASPQPRSGDPHAPRAPPAAAARGRAARARGATSRLGGWGGARSGRPQVFGSVGHSPAGTPALGGGSGGPRAPPPGPAPGALAQAGSPPWCRRGQLRGCFALRLLERG